MWSCSAIPTTGFDLTSFSRYSFPGTRVKEIAVGIMANMLCHEKVFLGILEKTRYLEKLLRLLEVKDSPTLSLVFR